MGSRKAAPPGSASVAAATVPVTAADSTSKPSSAPLPEPRGAAAASRLTAAAGGALDCLSLQSGDLRLKNVRGGAIDAASEDAERMGSVLPGLG